MFVYSCLVCCGDSPVSSMPFSLPQAKRAVQRGATAVIFDVSENPEAIDQVSIF